MKYLTISFREFVKNNLIEEAIKETNGFQQLDTNAIKSTASWIDNLRAEFEKIEADYNDNISKY